MHTNKVVLFILPLLLLSTVSTNGATSTLNVAVSAPAEVAEGSTVAISVMITTDNLTDVAYSLTTTAGEFNNSLATYSGVIAVNGTITLLINWVAPTPDQNLTVTFTVDISADSFTDITDSTTTEVYTVEHQFAVTTTLSKSSLYQNESLVISVTATDAVTADPVADATVTLELELGTFASGTGITQFTTDTSGTGTVTASFADLNLLFDKQNISLSVSIEKVKFATYEHTENFTLLKVKPIASFTVSATTLTISEGKSVTFLATAYLNNQPWANATIKITFTAGLVNDTADSFSGRTNADGQIVFVWSSASFPKLAEDQVIDVSVALINADYPNLTAKTFQITVQANTAAPLSFDTNNQTTPFYFTLLPIILLSRRRKS